MKITRENYEGFFLDYIEGNLAAERVSELLVFLAENPDLAAELDGLDTATTASNEVVFSFKNELKKPELPIQEEELDLLLAREAEGHVSADEAQLIEKLSAEFPFVAKLRAAFAKAVFVPELISFEHKQWLNFLEQADMQSIDMRMAASAEGDLNEQEEMALQNEIAISEVSQREYEVMKRAKLTASTESLEDKTAIAIPSLVDMSDVQNLLIAKVEGDLTLEQNQSLSALLAKDEKLQAVLALLYKTKLKPATVVFEGKNELRKKEAVVIPLRRIALAITSAAAVVALIVWFNFNTAVVPSETALLEDRNAQVKNANEQVANNSPTTKEEAEQNDKEVIVAPSQNDANDVALRKDAPEQIQMNNEQQDPAAQRLPHPNPMQMMEYDGALAMEAKNELKPSTVDMSLIHKADANKEVVFANAVESKPATILQLLGDAAEKRFEKTAAYALVERQAEKIAPQRDNFNYERTEDELKLKIGKLEVNRSKKRKDKDSNFFETLYNRIVKQ